MSRSLYLSSIGPVPIGSRLSVYRVKDLFDSKMDNKTYGRLRSKLTHESSSTEDSSSTEELYREEFLINSKIAFFKHTKGHLIAKSIDSDNKESFVFDLTIDDSQNCCESFKTIPLYKSRKRFDRLLNRDFTKLLIEELAPKSLDIDMTKYRIRISLYDNKYERVITLQNEHNGHYSHCSKLKVRYYDSNGEYKMKSVNLCT